MIEENFKDIDDDFITLFGRYYILQDRKTKRLLSLLAEKGQVNAAIFCLDKKIPFDPKLFVYSFINNFGANNKYLLLFEMYYDLCKSKNFKMFLRDYDISFFQNRICGNHVLPLLLLRNGETARIDQDISFTDFVNNAFERKKSRIYTRLTSLRNFYRSSSYYDKKTRVYEIFLEEFKNDKPKMANIINMIDKAEDVSILEPKISESMENLIINTYENNKSDRISAFSYIDLFFSYARTDRYIKNREFFSDKVEDIVDSLRMIGAKVLTTLDDPIKKKLENVK